MSGFNRLVIPDWMPRKVAFLSDLHIPYHDRPALAATLKYLSDWKPDLTIIGGDGIDCYSISEHDKDPGRKDTVQDELDAAQEVWRDIDSLSRRVIYLEGNHEHRLTRLVAKNPGLHKLRALEFPRAAQLPSRWLFYPDQTHLKIGGLVYLHGNLRGRGGSATFAAANMLRKMRVSCMFGHWHRFGAHYETGYDGTVRAGFANAHLSDVDLAEYVSVPDWQTGFSTVEYSKKGTCFGVRQHVIVNDCFVADGKEYKG